MFSSAHEAMDVKWALKTRDKQTLLLLGCLARPNEDREGKCSKVLCRSPVRNCELETDLVPVPPTALQSPRGSSPIF